MQTIGGGGKIKYCQEKWAWWKFSQFHHFELLVIADGVRYVLLCFVAIVVTVVDDSYDADD